MAFNRYRAFDSCAHTAVATVTVLTAHVNVDWHFKVKDVFLALDNVNRCLF